MRRPVVPLAHDSTGDAMGLSFYLYGPGDSGLVGHTGDQGGFRSFMLLDPRSRTADITVVNPNPTQLGTLKSAVAAVDRLKLDYDAWLPAHPPNPDRPLTKADVVAAAGGGK